MANTYLLFVARSGASGEGVGLLLSLVLEGAGERYEPDGDGRERPGEGRLHDQEQHPGSHLHFAV